MKFPFRKLYLLVAVLACASIPICAQDDPNPDSPIPILLSGSDTSRVLAVNTRGWDGEMPTRGPVSFRPSQSTSVTIFVSKLPLMADEGSFITGQVLSCDGGNSMRQ